MQATVQNTANQDAANPAPEKWRSNWKIDRILAIIANKAELQTSLEDSKTNVDQLVTNCLYLDPSRRETAFTIKVKQECLFFKNVPIVRVEPVLELASRIQEIRTAKLADVVNTMSGLASMIGMSFKAGFSESVEQDFNFMIAQPNSENDAHVNSGNKQVENTYRAATEGAIQEFSHQWVSEETYEVQIPFTTLAALPALYLNASNKAKDPLENLCCADFVMHLFSAKELKAVTIKANTSNPLYRNNVDNSNSDNELKAELVKSCQLMLLTLTNIGEDVMPTRSLASLVKLRNKYQPAFFPIKETLDQWWGKDSPNYLNGMLLSNYDAKVQAQAFEHCHSLSSFCFACQTMKNYIQEKYWRHQKNRANRLYSAQKFLIPLIPYLPGILLGLFVFLPTGLGGALSSGAARLTGLGSGLLGLDLLGAIVFSVALGLSFTRPKFMQLNWYRLFRSITNLVDADSDVVEALEFAKNSKKKLSVIVAHKVISKAHAWLLSKISDAEERNKQRIDDVGRRLQALQKEWRDIFNEQHDRMQKEKPILLLNSYAASWSDAPANSDLGEFTLPAEPEFDEVGISFIVSHLPNNRYRRGYSRLILPAYVARAPLFDLLTSIKPKTGTLHPYNFIKSICFSIDQQQANRQNQPDEQRIYAASVFYKLALSYLNSMSSTQSNKTTADLTLAKLETELSTRLGKNKKLTEILIGKSNLIDILQCFAQHGAFGAAQGEIASAVQLAADVAAAPVADSRSSAATSPDTLQDPLLTKLQNDDPKYEQNIKKIGVLLVSWCATLRDNNILHGKTDSTNQAVDWNTALKIIDKCRLSLVPPASVSLNAQANTSQANASNVEVISVTSVYDLMLEHIRRSIAEKCAGGVRMRIVKKANEVVAADNDNNQMNAFSRDFNALTDKFSDDLTFIRNYQLGENGANVLDLRSRLLTIIMRYPTTITSSWFEVEFDFFLALDGMLNDSQQDKTKRELIKKFMLGGISVINQRTNTAITYAPFLAIMFSHKSAIERMRDSAESNQSKPTYVERMAARIIKMFDKDVEKSGDNYVINKVFFAPLQKRLMNQSELNHEEDILYSLAALPEEYKNAVIIKWFYQVKVDVDTFKSTSRFFLLSDMLKVYGKQSIDSGSGIVKTWLSNETWSIDQKSKNFDDRSIASILLQLNAMDRETFLRSLFVQPKKQENLIQDLIQASVHFFCVCCSTLNRQEEEHRKARLNAILVEGVGGLRMFFNDSVKIDTVKFRLEVVNYKFVTCTEQFKLQNVDANQLTAGQNTNNELGNPKSSAEFVLNRNLFSITELPFMMRLSAFLVSMVEVKAASSPTSITKGMPSNDNKPSKEKALEAASEITNSYSSSAAADITQKILADLKCLVAYLQFDEQWSAEFSKTISSKSGIGGLQIEVLHDIFPCVREREDEQEAEQASRGPQI